MIDEQNTVKMVHFVLDTGRQQTLDVPFPDFIFVVEIAHPDRIGPGHSGKLIGQRQTAFLAFCIHIGNRYNLGVGHINGIGFVVGARHINHNDALIQTDLRRGQPNTIGRVHAFEHIVHEATNLLIHGRDRPTLDFEARVGRDDDGHNGHGGRSNAFFDESEEIRHGGRTLPFQRTHFFMETTVSLGLVLGLAALLIAVGAAIVVLRGRRNDTHEAITQMQTTLQAELLARLQAMTENQVASTAEINRTLNKSLTQSAEKTGESLTHLKERLAVIDSAQKNLTELSSQVVGLQDILSNKQTRGAFGETRLNDLVADALPRGSYETQVTLSNGKRVDCLIKMPNPPGSVSIDSKFPLEAYRRMADAKTDEDRTVAARAFGADVTKHVRDIADKYIIPGETADWALMFVPSEAVYAELHGTFANVIEDAHRRRIAIVSPNTLMAALTTVRAVLKDARMQEHAQIIQAEVQKLIDDVGRLDDRVESLKTHFHQAEKDIDNITISSKKITRRGESIEAIQLGDNDEAETLEPPKTKADGSASSDNIRPIRPA